MPAKVKKGASLAQKKARLKYLPKIMFPVLMGMTKKNADKFIKIFHDGIKLDKFGLIRLSQFTEKWKRSQGYKKPEVPLFGKGDEDKKKSFVNMLRVKKLKNGWKVFPSWGKHHKANQQLRQLLKIHEEGRTFKVKEKLIRIPPRPAFLEAMKKFKKEVNVENQNKQLKSAISQYVNTGKSKYLDNLVRYFEGEGNKNRE